MDYTRPWVRTTSWVLTGLVALFFLNDAYGFATRSPLTVTKVADPLHIPHGLMPAVAATCLACLALYLVPATQRLGLVLLTGYLGGAAAMNLMFEPGGAADGAVAALSVVLIGVIVWIPPWIRDGWVRQLFAPAKGREALPAAHGAEA